MSRFRWLLQLLLFPKTDTALFFQNQRSISIAALSSRMIERVLSGCVTRGNQNRVTPDGEPRMSYTEFVWFLLAEEDKTHPTAIEYWFR